MSALKFSALKFSALKFSALKFGESGQYAELVKRPLPEGLSLVFIPSLAALLMRAQQRNGAALDENQVLRIRDGSNVMAVGRDAVRTVEEQRGYVDIDAVNVWQSWLQLQAAQA